MWYTKSYFSASVIQTRKKKLEKPKTNLALTIVGRPVESTLQVSNRSLKCPEEFFDALLFLTIENKNDRKSSKQQEALKS